VDEGVALSYDICGSVCHHSFIACSGCCRYSDVTAALPERLTCAVRRQASSKFSWTTCPVRSPYALAFYLPPK
jgi:hypothetical protein